MLTHTLGPPAIPGPPPVPVLGWRANLLPLLRDPIGYMRHLYTTYGDVVAVAAGHPQDLFVFAPEYNRQILSDQGLFYNGDLDSAAGPVRIPRGSAAARLFSGLTTANGAQHTQQRRLLMPAFHKQHVLALRDEMVTLIEGRLAGWRPGDQRDILREMQQLTLAVALRTILGLDPDREGEGMRRLLARWLRLVLSPAVIVFPLDLPGLPFHRLLRTAEEVEGAIRAMIARKRARGGDGSDALSMLLQAHDADGTRLRDDQLVGHTTTLFVAGHETTASALTWTLFLLVQHPDVYRAVIAELEGTLHGAPPVLDQLDALPLLDAVIQESMRLLPPGLFFLRVATAPAQFGPYAVAPGTRIFWSPAITHRRPDLYPEPDRFLPARWAHLDPSPYEYLPFGAGPRRCLGATFALLELKLVLSILLPRFRLSLRPGTRVDLARSPLAAPRGGLLMDVHGPDHPLTRVAVVGTIRAVVDLEAG